jgi:hypothetical protein
MLPTPAHTTPGNSPRLPNSQLPESEVPDVTYPEAPQNRGSAPFSVLSGLFDKIQNERKPDKRRKFLSAWFDVRFHVYLIGTGFRSCEVFSSIGVRKSAMTSTLCCVFSCLRKTGSEQYMV